MTASPATTLREDPRADPRDEVGWRLAQDLFMHVASSSRAVEGARGAIASHDSGHLEDLAVELENAITQVCGRTARAVMERADLMALAFSVDERTHTWLHAIGLEESDKLARAIYEESGILEEFRAHNT